MTFFAYQYAGDTIGGKYADPDLQFSDGGVDYSKVERLSKFVDGIDHLIRLSTGHVNPVLLCAEKDPYFCHRFALISHALSKKGIITRHILYEGSSTVSNTGLEDIMRSEYGEHVSLDELYSHHNRYLFF